MVCTPVSHDGDNAFPAESARDWPKTGHSSRGHSGDRLTRQRIWWYVDVVDSEYTSTPTPGIDIPTLLLALPPTAHPHPHTSLLSRYLWCWSGCCASSSPGCPQPPAPGGRGDHLLGRQGHCLRHWRTLHQNQGGTVPLCTTLTTNLVLSDLTFILFDTLDWDARNEERLWRGSGYPGSILRGCQTGRAHATATLLTTLALTPEE